MQPNDGIQSTYENIKAVRTRDVETGRFTAGPLLNYSEGLHAEMGTISKALKIPGLPKPPKPAGATGGILKPRKPRIGAPNTVKAPTVPSTKIATPKSPRVKQTGIGKSYIPGRGWVPAAQAGKKALRAASGKNTHRNMRQVSFADKKFVSTAREGASEVNKHPVLSSTRNKHGATVNTREAFLPPGTEGLTVSRGGRKSGTRDIVLPPGKSRSPSFESVRRHEMAHATPKRSSYRMNQILTNPRKLAGEEARADMAGGIKYRNALPNNSGNRARTSEVTGTSGYQQAASSPTSRIAMKNSGFGDATYKNMFRSKNMKRYREVQDKIDVGAGNKKKRLGYNWSNYGKPAAVSGGVYGLPAAAVSAAVYNTPAEKKKREAAMKKREAKKALKARKEGLSKAMPDQSAVNVLGNTKVLRPRKKGVGPMVLKRPHER